MCVLLGGVGIGMVIHLAHMVQEGSVRETLAHASGACERNRIKA
jgi:hypothetical protein